MGGSYLAHGILLRNYIHKVPVINFISTRDYSEMNGKGRYKEEASPTSKTVMPVVQNDITYIFYILYVSPDQQLRTFSASINATLEAN